MKTKVLLIVFVFTGIHSFAQKKGTKNLPVNEPLPREFLVKSSEIYFEKNIEFLDSRKQIYTTYGSTFLLHALIENQVEIKENEISKEKVFKDDPIELPKILANKYMDLFKNNNIEFAENKNNSSYTLAIKIFDHGFHWATSSAAGMFVRAKVELVSSAGETVWEQYYMMDKKEAKIPFNCKGINMNKAIDNNIKGFEKDPGLLNITYGQIAGFLAAKLIAPDK